MIMKMTIINISISKIASGIPIISPLFSSLSLAVAGKQNTIFIMLVEYLTSVMFSA